MINLKEVNEQIIWREKHPKGIRNLKKYINEITDIKIEWEGSYSLEDIGFNETEYNYSKKKL